MQVRSRVEEGESEKMEHIRCKLEEQSSGGMEHKVQVRGAE